MEIKYVGYEFPDCFERRPIDDTELSLDTQYCGYRINWDSLCTEECVGLIAWKYKELVSEKVPMYLVMNSTRSYAYPERWYLSQGEAVSEIHKYLNTANTVLKRELERIQRKLGYEY